MNNKRRLFSTVLCVAALTAGLFVSGCGSDKAGGIGSVVSSVVDGGDEKAAAKLNTLIDATNRFNSDNASFAEFQAEGLAKLKGGFAEGAITNQPHFDRLQADLEKAKKEGSTFKEVDALRSSSSAMPLERRFGPACTRSMGRSGQGIRRSGSDRGHRRLRCGQQGGHHGHARSSSAWA